MRMTCSKPWVFMLEAISVSNALNVSSVRLMLPGYFICPVGGLMSPSGTNGTIGATSAFPSFRAMASAVAGGELGAFLLDPTLPSDPRPLASFQRPADLGPGHFPEPHRINGIDRTRH